MKKKNKIISYYVYQVAFGDARRPSSCCRPNACSTPRSARDTAA